MLAGQHYQYLLRQMTEIRDGKRPETPPEMFTVITKYSDAQLLSLMHIFLNRSLPGFQLQRKAGEQVYWETPIWRALPSR